ncbi:hypothetical protein [Sporolactobacillus shoreicorticis]|uniref:Uncharacterized protein n=1 Tax=Sporolactobacillus shoreicorticis TaxID=1923877 RepID=A0ABW5S4U5_9BACL|nr:hypothetical protein [Sporolactobacillus shoreicorticis]
MIENQLLNPVMKGRVGEQGLAVTFFSSGMVSGFGMNRRVRAITC